MTNKKIIISVSNDLTNDQRVYRIASCMQDMGNNVVVIGRNRANFFSKTKKDYFIMKQYDTTK